MFQIKTVNSASSRLPCTFNLCRLSFASSVLRIGWFFFNVDSVANGGEHERKEWVNIFNKLPTATKWESAYPLPAVKKDGD